MFLHYSFMEIRKSRGVAPKVREDQLPLALHVDPSEKVQEDDRFLDQHLSYKSSIGIRIGIT